MAEFSKLIITKAGQALVAKVLSGSESKIRFTKVSVSSARYLPEQLEELTGLDEVRQTSSVSKVTYTDNMEIRVDATISNRDVTEGYYIHNLGLYAIDPDAGEVLYAVTREMSGNCYMPSYNGVTATSVYIQLISAVGNSENVSLEVNPGAYASAIDVEELREDINVVDETVSAHLQESGNPHGVTKQDIGLGNVENKKAVSTEEQTLTDAEKEQARANIGASSFSGSYNDLTNKPTSLPASDTTSDYSATGTVPVNGAAVYKALQTLDVASKGGAGKYIQSISETDGKISAIEATMPTIPAAVRVKGNAETTYHTGDVNLTPAAIGAVALSGGTMTGILTVKTPNVASSSIGGSAVNLCTNTLKVSPGSVTVSGGASIPVMQISTINGLSYRPVVIGPSAPSDKTALWIDTSK